MCNEMETDAFN